MPVSNTNTPTELYDRFLFICSRNGWHNPRMQCRLTYARMSKRNQTLEEARVTLAFEEMGKPITLTMQRYPYAIENLRALVQALDMIHTAIHREVRELVVKFLRQLYPQPYNAPTEAPRTPLATAYQTLHLAENAPPAVVQAAWRALAKQHHPDYGGSAAVMVEINAAYQLINTVRRSA